jgi:hypothetical protein
MSYVWRHQSPDGGAAKSDGIAVAAANLSSQDGSGTGSLMRCSPLRIGVVAGSAVRYERRRGWPTLAARPTLR